MISTIQELDDVVESNMVDFAKSSFIDRYPSMLDGLKPVVRRILYAMKDINITDKSNTVKTAQIVGNVIGKLHPHGDQAAYGALVAVAQPFTLNYALIDGQGNFGNLLGDGAASYRYTEARFTEYGYRCLLKELNDGSVEFVPTFDNRWKEPSVLPAILPNLVINGTYAIAGAAFNSSIPPHNLNEVLDITIALIQNPNITNEDIGGKLLPDFPFGGVLLNPEDIQEYYKHGTPATIRMMAKYEIDRDNNTIHIYELPYLVDGNSLKDEIKRKFPKLKDIGIDDIIPDCSENTMDFMIVYNKNANPDKLMNLLIAKTRICASSQLMFTCTLDDKLRENCTLKDMFTEWIRFRRQVVRKNIMHRIQKIYRDTHILEALIRCFDQINDIIAMIRTSSSKDAIIHTLISKYKFTILQAEAIASMKLYDLSKSSKQELITDHDKLIAEMNELRKMLNKTSIDSYIITELTDLKEKFGRPRRTEIKFVANHATEHVFDYPLVLAKIANTCDIYIVKHEALLTPGSHRITLGKNRGIETAYMYNPQNDYLFALTNLGYIYKVPDIVTYLEHTTIDVNTWRQLAIDKSPRVNEKIIDFIIIPKTSFENAMGDIIIYASDHTIRKLPITIIPQRIATNGYQLLKLKDDSILIGAKYMQHDVNALLGYGFETGHVHVYPIEQLPNATRLAGNVSYSSSSFIPQRPSILSPDGAYYFVLANGEIITGNVSEIAKRRAGATPCGLHVAGRKQPGRVPIQFGGMPKNGLLLLATDGNIFKPESDGVAAVIEL